MVGYSLGGGLVWRLRFQNSFNFFLNPIFAALIGAALCGSKVMLHDTQLREAEIASGPFSVCGVSPPLGWTLPVDASVHLVSRNLGEADHAPASGACVNAKGGGPLSQPPPLYNSLT